MSAGFDSFVPSDCNGAFQSHETHEGRECLQFRESRESRAFHECPVSPASPMSNGHGLDKEVGPLVALKGLAARNPCTECNTARERRWELAREVRALEKAINRELTIGELKIVFDEWYQLSRPFLDPAKTRDDYLAMFLGELGKVRVPTGEGDTLNKALAGVSKLSLSELPSILGMPQAAESWRRVLALHRELARLSTNKNKTYFLSYRDAAKASAELNHQAAYNITLALERLNVIEIVHKGQARANGGKAAEFRYLLP